MCNTEKNEENYNISLTPDAIEEKVCSSCRIGIKQLETMTQQLNKIFTAVEDHHEEVFEWDSSRGASYYELSKYWLRYSKELENIKSLIDQNKTISEIREYYFRDRRSHE